MLRASRGSATAAAVARLDRRPRDARLRERCRSSRRRARTSNRCSPIARSPAEGAVGPRRRVRRLRLEPRADLRVGHERRGRCPTMCSQRLVESREPFWATIERDDETFRVYFLSDRGGIYALGYPVITLVRPPDQPGGADHARGRAVRAAARPARRSSARSTSRTPASGRALLREVRSSFYRKLFLAFWRARSCRWCIAGDRDRAPTSRRSCAPASRRRRPATATVAQRLVEDYATLQQRGADARCARSTIRSWCSSAARSIRT